MMGGVLADRVDRRRLLVSLQIIQGALSFGLAFVAWSSHPSTVAIAVIVFAIGIANALGAPGLSAILPTLVPREDLTGAVSLTSVQMNLSRVIGPVDRRADLRQARRGAGVRDQRRDLPVRRGRAGVGALSAVRAGGRGPRAINACSTGCASPAPIPSSGTCCSRCSRSRSSRSRSSASCRSSRSTTSTCRTVCTASSTPPSAWERPRARSASEPCSRTAPRLALLRPGFIAFAIALAAFGLVRNVAGRVRGHRAARVHVLPRRHVPLDDPAEAVARRSSAGV